MVRGQGVAGPHPDVVTDHGESLVPECVHQRHHVACERAGVVPVQGLVGQTDTTRIDRDDLEVLGQRGHQEAPGVPGLGPAGEQQQRGSFAAGHGVQAQLAGVDVLAGEGVGESGREAGRPGDGTGAFGRGQVG